MSVDVQEPATTGPQDATRGGAWTVTWSGVRTVTALELRQRVRSTRWIVSLVIFAVIVGTVSALTFLATANAYMGSGIETGRTMFGFIVFFVLFLGLLVSPTLSATAINGDRSAGTLATLQVTLLSPAEIVLGKLLASWTASLAFLAVSVPFIVWAFAVGGTPFVALLTTLLLLAVVLAVVCAIGLGFSALTARTAGSSVLTYVAVAGLSVITLILFGLSLPLVSGEERVQVYEEQWPSGDVAFDDMGNPVEDIPCELVERDRYVVRTERTWWLLAANPFVVVADAFPGSYDPTSASFDPMTGIRYGVRMARLGTQEPLQECYWGQDWEEQQREQADRANALGAVWPFGIAFQLLLGTAGVATAVRRLTIPQAKLPKGTRVA